MEREELVSRIKALCDKHGAKYVDDIRVGRSILIMITSEKAVKQLDTWLSDLGLPHTTPMMMTDAIGSYVEL